MFYSHSFPKNILYHNKGGKPRTDPLRTIARKSKFHSITCSSVISTHPIPSHSIPPHPPSQNPKRLFILSHSLSLSTAAVAYPSQPPGSLFFSRWIWALVSILSSVNCVFCLTHLSTIANRFLFLSRGHLQIVYDRLLPNSGGD